MKLGGLRSALFRHGDPFDRYFLQEPPLDPRNLVVNRIREAPEGSIFAVKAETHTPEVMARHIKELGRFFGADLVRIVESRLLSTPDRTESEDAAAADLPFAVLLGFRAEHDPRDAPGIGGHAVALKAAFATFQIGAIIREMGFAATIARDLDAEGAAVDAGIGRLNKAGRLTVPRFGARIFMADAILTALPVKPDRTA